MDQSPTLPPTAAATAEPPARMEPDRFVELARGIESEVGRVIVGQADLVRQTLICLLASGHALLEGVPGLGKTMLVRTIADVVDCSFNRIQFTPDLMPADIIGTNILVEEGGSRVFRFQQGPIFANLVLADEINRATPKTQSALLEAMQEHQVSVARARYRLDEPFFVLATQNPLEMEGTYPLPEAQLDRFMFKVHVPFPTEADMALILERTTGTDRPDASRRCRRRGRPGDAAPRAGRADRTPRHRLRGRPPGRDPPRPAARPGAGPGVRPLRRLAARRPGPRGRGQGARPPRRTLQRLGGRPARHRPARASGTGSSSTSRARPRGSPPTRSSGRSSTASPRRSSSRPPRGPAPWSAPRRTPPAPPGRPVRRRPPCLPAVRRRSHRLRRGLPAPPRAARRARPATGPGRPQGRAAEREARPVGGVRRLPRLQPGRRPAPARLERLRAPGEALRQALHRGGGPDGHLPGRRLGLDGPRHPRQAGLREAGGGGPRLHRPRRRGSRRPRVAGRAGGPPAGRPPRAPAAPSGSSPSCPRSSPPTGSPTSWPRAATPWPR